MHRAFPPPETMIRRFGGLLLLLKIQFHLIPIKPSPHHRWTCRRSDTGMLTMAENQYRVQRAAV
ncbi:hypothetical protein [Azospirillum endophyticum]